MHPMFWNWKWPGWTLLVVGLFRWLVALVVRWTKASFFFMRRNIPRLVKWVWKHKIFTAWTVAITMIASVVLAIYLWRTRSPEALASWSSIWESTKSFDFLIFCGLMLLLILLVLVTIGQGLANPQQPDKKKGGLKEPKAVRWWEGWLAKLKDIPTNYRLSWMIRPVVIFAIWGLLVGVLCQNFFPDYFKWLWTDDRKLFWTIPAIISLAIIFYSYKRREAFIGATLLLLLLGSATFKSFKQTPMGVEYVARKAAEKEKQEQERIEREDALYRKARVATGPDNWSEPVLFKQGDHYNYTLTQHCTLTIMTVGKDTGRTTTKTVDAGDPLPTLDLTPENHTVTFKTDIPAEVIVKFTPVYR